MDFTAVLWYILYRTMHSIPRGCESVVIWCFLSVWAHRVLLMSLYKGRCEFEFSINLQLIRSKKNILRWKLSIFVYQNSHVHTTPSPCCKSGLPFLGSCGSYNLNEYSKHRYFIAQLLFFTDISDYFLRTSLLAELLGSMFKIEGLFPYVSPFLDFSFRGGAINLCSSIWKGALGIRQPCKGA